MNEQHATLLLLIPGFPANEDDTTCLPSQQLLVKELNKLFPELQIIILAFEYPFVDKEYKWFSNRVIPFNGRVKSKVQRLLLWTRIWKKLNQLRKNESITGIFCCWCGDCALIGKYFGKRYSLKYFIWICGQDAKKKNKLVRIIRPPANSLIAISDFLVKEFLKNHSIKPAHVIPIGIEPSEFMNKKNSVRDIDVLGVGSLIPLKQYDVFIEVVEQLKQEFVNINAVICGDGPEFEKLKMLIQAKGLQKNILLPGKKSHDEVLQLMHRSKILLHPSSYEGFGAVCIEALYAGAHVISFCKPLDQSVLHWHITENKKDMLERALEILKDPATNFSPVLVNDMETSAAMIMKLFNYADK